MVSAATSSNETTSPKGLEQVPKLTTGSGRNATSPRVQTMGILVGSFLWFFQAGISQQEISKASKCHRKNGISIFCIYSISLCLLQFRKGYIYIFNYMYPIFSLATFFRCHCFWEDSPPPTLPQKTTEIARSIFVEGSFWEIPTDKRMKLEKNPWLSSHGHQKARSTRQLVWNPSKWSPTLRNFKTWYCWWFRNPVNSPVEVDSLSHYLQGFIHPRWLFGISEPSTVSSNSPQIEAWCAERNVFANKFLLRNGSSTCPFCG